MLVKAACRHVRDNAAMSIQELSPAQARERLAHGAVLIDVREAHERAGGMAEGARGVAKGELQADPAAHLPRHDQEILLICQSGKRSADAAQFLLEAGYTRVASVTGGTVAWREQSLPLVQPLASAADRDFYDRYSRHLAVHTRLFPGLDAILLRLEQQSVPWGIVTNKPSIYTLPLLDALGLRIRCASVVCPDQVTHTKPHPEPMFKACAQMGVAPGACVYVGDHERDIAAGRNAGMATIAAGWGYIGANEHPRDWQPDFIVDSVRAFGELLFAHATP